jgi:hypothetical protein
MLVRLGLAVGLRPNHGRDLSGGRPRCEMDRDVRRGLAPTLVPGPTKETQLLSPVLVGSASTGSPARSARRRVMGRLNDASELIRWCRIHVIQSAVGAV